MATPQLARSNSWFELYLIFGFDCAKLIIIANWHASHELDRNCCKSVVNIIIHLFCEQCYLCKMLLLLQSACNRPENLHS